MDTKHAVRIERPNSGQIEKSLREFKRADLDNRDVRSHGLQRQRDPYSGEVALHIERSEDKKHLELHLIFWGQDEYIEVPMLDGEWDWLHKPEVTVDLWDVFEDYDEYEVLKNFSARVAPGAEAWLWVDGDKVEARVQIRNQFVETWFRWRGAVEIKELVRVGFLISTEFRNKDRIPREEEPEVEAQNE